ncbi:MAG: metallophosphoesterase family protein [Planctomycetota bacterium]
MRCLHWAPVFAWAVVTLGMGAAPAVAQDDPFDTAFRIGRDVLEALEVRPLDEAPAWAERDEEPLMTFVQFADIHHTARREPELLRAIDFVNQELRPDWVVLTGDNISRPSIEHHAHLKALLDKRLSAPSRVIQGDNDSLEFTSVFGTSDWAFSAAGVRFYGLAIDADVMSKGIGYFKSDTVSWLREDLEAHKKMPAVVFLHEPVAPPSFLDAPRLRMVLRLAGNVEAVIAGHIHYDLEEEWLGMTHITAPALGPSRGHGVKEYRLYADGFVVRTYEVGEDGQYAFANKWQRIAFDDGRRASPIEDRTARLDRNDRPARETEYPAWLSAAHEAGMDRLRRVYELLRPGGK